MANTSITSISLPSLTKVASGKVRDLFALPSDPSSLLFVASDRVSAFDVVLANGIPGKGAVLTQLSAHWFRVLESAVPGLRHHLRSLAPPPIEGLSAAERAALRGRAMLVQRCRVLPVECIVRGYVTGSAWAEYEARGTVHGLPLPAGIPRCGAIPGGAVYTPSTKAAPGEHDENITPERAAEIIGNPKLAAHVGEIAKRVYEAAAAHALEKGIIVADTKFEFGVDEATGEIVLVDEVLTPDSSRFWAADKYEAGREQESLDKQPLRDWLTREGLKGKEGVEMPEEVFNAAADRYQAVFKMLTGKTVEEAMAEAGL
jgi:phosphoribosylaminoimidazole-succinocarboxamide synthase